MPNTKPRPELHTADTLRLYWQASLPYKRLLVRIAALPISNVLLGVFGPYFASKVLADIVTGHHAPWHHFYWFVGIALAGFVLNGISIRACMELQARVMGDLHDMVFSRLLRRSVGFYNNRIGGKLVSDAHDFVASYGQLFNSGYITAFGFLLTIVTGLVLVFVSNWIIGATITVLLGGLSFWTYRGIVKRSGFRNARLVISKRLISHLSDSLVNAVTVKTFAAESTEARNGHRLNTDLAQARMTDWKRTVGEESNRMGVLLLMQTALILVLILLTRQHPDLLAAGIFAFTYTLTLINRFFTVNTLARQIEEAFLQASPMTELLQEPAEVVDAPGARALKLTRGAIDLTDVAFHYADAPESDPIFTGLNLHIKPGEKIGLVGHSGGGKTTLTRLLLRFDDITAGSITIDGQDIALVTQSSLRKQIAYVPQEPLLFHRSIRENISYGKAGASGADIEAAARMAYAHGFITALPEGYDTTVGERGVKLSGGQRQRIAIARAILKDAPILILDEATSALDSESEKAIQKALWKLMKKRTAVVVAHRLSTIQKMDRIIVLDNGVITEMGSHQELLAAKGTYAKLWGHQSGGFIEE
jgi:ATP-binding cassette subfamily B protein